MDTERTMKQDLAFGSGSWSTSLTVPCPPAVNDPTTAAQTIDVLHDLLRSLATRQLPDGHWAAPDGKVRLIVPQYGFTDFLDLAVSEIWRYGADAAQVSDGDRTDTWRPETDPTQCLEDGLQ